MKKKFVNLSWSHLYILSNMCLTLQLLSYLLNVLHFVIWIKLFLDLQSCLFEFCIGISWMFNPKTSKPSLPKLIVECSFSIFLRVGTFLQRIETFGNDLLTIAAIDNIEIEFIVIFLHECLFLRFSAVIRRLS